MDRTDERDARRVMPAEPDVHAAAADSAAVRESAAGAEEPHVAEPPTRTTVNTQAVVGNIPSQRPGFQPRPNLLAQLNRPREGAPVVQVLIGTQGVGKTQLAAAYARARLAVGWRLVAWVNAGNTGSLRAGLAAVADAVGQPHGSSGSAADDTGRALRHWLEADGDRCLVVFDDAEDPNALRPFLPSRGAAEVLITTSQPSMTDLGISIPVGVFTAEEALALLDGRTGRADEAGATAVIAELGYLPLALDQAAVMITAQDLGYEGYLEQLRTLSVETHRAGGEEPYSLRAAEAVLLSLDAVRAARQAGAAAGILEVTAVLSAAGVSRALLGTCGEAGALSADGHRVSAAMVDHALAQLTDQAMLTFTIDGQTVIIHQMIARIVRDELARRGRLAMVCRAAASILEARAKAMAGSQDRIAIRDIPEQVAALLENASKGEEELTRILLRLRFWALYHLIELGDGMPQAIEIGEPLTADLERALGPDHADTLNARNSLAAAYQVAGRSADAISLFEQILVARERLLGPDHPDTLTTQNNLAAAYQDTGRSAEAILLFRLTLAGREQLLGTSHPGTLNSLGNLAAAYQDAGRSVEAIPLFERALAGRERLLGPDHTDTLHSRANLAAAYRDAGRAADAIPLIQQTLATRERLLGTDHPSTLTSRNNLASAYRAAGHAAEAIPLFERNVAACERQLGTDHPRTLASRHNLDHARQEAEQTGRGSEAGAEE
jgi:tetratricopeptide (TPR) repeat protein